MEPSEQDIARAVAEATESPGVAVEARESQASSGGMATPDDIARMLKVSVRTVQRMADDGEVPYYRVREQLRFDVAEVRAALRVERSA